jgi:AMMECR1 domain-containing protein
LLLPQVATEWGWSPEQFLRQTCVKAGLRPEAWEREALVFRFTAEVFGDGIVRPSSYS